MNRNDSGINARELARASAAAEAQNAIDPKDYWTRASSTDTMQFTGDGNSDKKVVASTQTRADAPGTYTVRDKDSLWSIASKMVNDSNRQDKSDKFKLDVVKGLVEKNKGSIKGLEANPDKISAGQVLKTDDVETLAKLGHGKVLNTHYKPPSEREKSEGAPRAENDLPREPKHRPQHGKYAGYDNGQYGDQQQFSQRPMDLGPVRDILGMFGAIAGGAMMADRFNDRRHHHWGHHHGPRGIYDNYGQNYYDNYNYRHPYRQQQYQFQSPIEYSHYGRPHQNYGIPLNDLTYRMQPNNAHAYQQRLMQQQLHQQQRQQWHQYHRHT